MATKRIPHIPLASRDPATVRAVILARVSDPGARDITVESQTDACAAFITTMGWRLRGSYSDKRSGYLHVERPGLDEVERLIVRRDVDVVVVLNWERLARDITRRYAALYLARKYGVEYRFAELLPDGRLADTPEARLYASMMESFGELSRHKIIENTKRGREKRASLGLPSGGRGGPPYGFRKAVAGEPFSYWMENVEEAEVVRGMFARAATDENASARALATELNSRDIRTREGRQWTPQTILDKLANPLYCGRATLNRWEVAWEPQTDEATGETYDVRKVKERKAAERLPIRDGAMPVLIEPALFDRVQAMLTERRVHYGKLGRANSPHFADATLLDSFVRCAHCGHAMVRDWRSDSKRTAEHPVPQYRCSVGGRDPANPCKIHSTPAAAVDELVKRLLAFALTDPEQVLALADAAAVRSADAARTAEITTATRDSYADQLAQVVADRAKLVKKLALSDPMDADDAEDIARYRERLASLEAKQARLDGEMARVGPKADRATERAVLLARIAAARGTTLDITAATVLMGMEGARERMVAGSHLSNPPLRVPLANVVDSLLARASRPAVRRVLRDLDVVVEIRRPRSKAERAVHGLTPIEERVSIHIGDLVLRSPSVANGTPFVTWGLRKPA